MKLKLVVLTAFVMVCFMTQAQQTGTKAFYHGKVSSVEYVSSIASRPNDLIPPDNSVREAKDKRSLGNQITTGKDPQTENDYFFRNKNVMEQSIQRAPASLVFDTYTSNSQPTDPSIAVGPNHVVVVYNTGFMIYDKSGNQLVGQTSPNPAIFPSGGCCDLTASYDNAADRWVLSFLGSGAQVAVSDGPNPVTSGWYVYNISGIQDYQKLSVWSDGYYITENTGGTNKLWALERDAMLAGDPNAQILGFNLPGIVTSGFFSPQALNVTDGNLPAAGGATIVYLQDNAWNGVSVDHIKVWTADVNWNNPGSSTVSNPQEIVTTPFISVFDGGSFVNLSQPGGGTSIDALQATIMNQAQFRKFATHNSAVFNFVVDADASSGELAAIRWYEFRQNGDNQPWSLYQEGTYTAPDGRHAWHASLAMDGQGNIGMGYTSMSGPTTPSTVRVSSYFTGRLSSDPLGTMTTAEELIANGTGNIPGTRYGDYSKIDVDPTDDSSFWFINEYVNGGRRGVVGKFQIEAGVPDTEAPSDPTNLVASNITSNGATLNWTASTDNVGVARYTISIGGTVVGTSTTANFSVTGLSPLTSYTASVTAEDAAGNVSGSATTSFTTIDGSTAVYCDSASTNVNDEFISNVQLNTINNGSGAQFYSDFTGISTDLNEGQTYTVTVTPTWTGTVYAEGYAVWIDYNNNGDFDDAGELVWSKSPSTDTPSSGSFTVPTGTSETSVRMRISMKYNAIPTSCETFTYGEVEDYTINLGTNGGGGTSGEIAAYYFETGFEGWIDGGSDCARINNSARAFEGDFSIRLRDNSASSNAVSPILDLTGNTEVSIEFHTFANAMENGEDYFIEFFNGSSYEVIGQYVTGTDFNNGSFFTDTIVLDAGTYNFNASNRFRIRCDASVNNDQVYFDQIIIRGDNARSTTPANAEDTNETAEVVSFTRIANKSIQLYPIPATSTLNIEINEGTFDEIIMISSNGTIVKKINPKTSSFGVDISQFADGLYFVRFTNSNGLAITKRFIVKK
ncbi:T9SS C-terminal target domain-containing protein [Aquimarina sp. BL5]|uniref:GEVED domain-containing protein n=1 Tax=Aquimarina sp. BL5 TaxID=1714860 RepID=UPI000E51241F|nr:GEVED domain-containing protein [Aquimarina sp. BL5]AXT49733.1 T9SS C-terminal target domain-containing protein [Aquimarina sp. BL5]RKM93843.1 T9SS C-terminal target domain-containing protein [Aquimarina sp. BL5]